MKIAMLYRSRTKLSPAHVQLTPTLFIRVEVVEVKGNDLSRGLGEVKERAGEAFINCVAADAQ